MRQEKAESLVESRATSSTEPRILGTVNNEGCADRRARERLDQVLVSPLLLDRGSVYLASSLVLVVMGSIVYCK